MTAPAVEIRRLGPEEAALYRALRLEALERHPEAYSSAYETEAARPPAAFAERLERSAVLGAWAGGTLVGIAGFFAFDGPKEAHKGALVGVYVRPDARRAGIARALALAIIAHARGVVELLHLGVGAGNAPARRLYESLGFVAYGIEPKALKIGGRYHDEVLMVLELRPAGLGAPARPEGFTEISILYQHFTRHARESARERTNPAIQGEESQPLSRIAGEGGTRRGATGG